MNHTQLLAAIDNKSAHVGVIGLGYVGLPLAVTAAERGYQVTGFDVDPTKTQRLEEGKSYIEAVSDEALERISSSGKVAWSTDFSGVGDCQVVIICVPTPLTQHREPDLSYIEMTAETISENMSPETLVVLESTTFPGTTRDVLTPLLAESGLREGEEFWVAFSPEREDPGNASFSTATIPKIVAGDGPEAGELALAFYSNIVDKAAPVSTTSTAEAVKITENVFRAVNIALVNELKLIYDAMDIDVWEVIDGAATKPFGFMPFYPGPGLGGHCIPIDPFYLTWKAREFDHSTRFIELAGEINVNMPRHIVTRVREVLDRNVGMALSRSRVLVIGAAYKKNVSDMRESPAVQLIELLSNEGATVEFHDPHVPEIPPMRNYPKLAGQKSVDPKVFETKDFDLILIATDHDDVDYAGLVALGLPIVDTRNIIKRLGLPMTHVTKA